MKRMHIHISVDDLQKGIEFYRVLFDSEPDKQRDDYARWKLTDPAVTLAISTRSSRQGIDHLGIQVDEESELQTLRSRLEQGQGKHFRRGRDGLLLCAIRKIMDRGSCRCALGSVSNNERRIGFP